MLISWLLAKKNLYFSIFMEFVILVKYKKICALWHNVFFDSSDVPSGIWTVLNKKKKYTYKSGMEAGLGNLKLT